VLCREVDEKGGRREGRKGERGQERVDLAYAWMERSLGVGAALGAV